MITDRRRACAALMAGIGALYLPVPGARAQAGNLYDLPDDAGKPIANYRLPSELSTEGLPRIVWTGSKTPDAILVEFFDYNCPFCKKKHLGSWMQ